MHAHHERRESEWETGNMSADLLFSIRRPGYSIRRLATFGCVWIIVLQEKRLESARD